MNSYNKHSLCAVAIKDVAEYTTAPPISERATLRHPVRVHPSIRLSCCCEQTAAQRKLPKADSRKERKAERVARIKMSLWPGFIRPAHHRKEERDQRVAGGG